MDAVAWAALMSALTLVLAVGTVRALRRGGAVSGLRWSAATLLPPAAWLTGTLEMFTEMAGSVADWATGLVFNPLVWAGTAMFGTSVALLLAARGIDRRRSAPHTAAVQPRSASASEDPDFADIEELLRKRGIN